MNEFRYIVAGNTDALLVELSNLHTGETAYITANEFERITGADLNEFSTAGRRLIGDMAAQSWCTIRVADGASSSQKNRHIFSALLGGPVSDFKNYQKRAADCLRLAQEVSDPTNKAMLLEMAQTWVSLAEQELAKRNKDPK